MSWLRYVRRRERDDDFSQEIEAYLEHEIDQNMARGMNPAVSPCLRFIRFFDPSSEPGSESALPGLC